MDTAKVEFEFQFREAKEHLLYSYDGPVTLHVLLSRAIEAARQGKFAMPDDLNYNCADPLVDALIDEVTHIVLDGEHPSQEMPQ